MKKLLAILLFVSLLAGAKAQQPIEALPETDSLILNRLDRWQDLKFGFMAHWGIYSQWGVMESWTICNEPWVTRNGEPYNDYVARYQALNTTFNPKQFNPKQWADLAATAGMKYFVFTTKHHDGFCMFDTEETTYSSTHSSCPYFRSKYSNITRSLVEAFRAKGMWTGLYFSKADWHHPDYWAPEWATPDRNVNYDPIRYPDRWNRFKDFTFHQIEELMSNYGTIDILWLDAGWIRPQWSLTDESIEWLGCHQYIQDIDMPAIADMARQKNPNLLIVDRSVGGKYENYRTPEQQVPDTLLPYPWETCMTMGDSWSYLPNDNYKSTNTLVHLLCDVVAKGGNLLLNVGPDADGNIPQQAQKRMKEIGKWLWLNGNAIYGSRPMSPYCYGKMRFTQSKNGSSRYLIYLLDEGETLPDYIELPEGISTAKPKMKLRGKLSVQKNDNHYYIFLNVKEQVDHAMVIEL